MSSTPSPNQLLQQVDGFLGNVLGAIDPCVQFEQAVGQPARPFQRALFESTARRVICMASRQLGKSSAMASLCWRTFQEGKTVVIVAPTERQAREALLRVQQFRDADIMCPPDIEFLKTEVSSRTHPGRIIALTATEAVRGYSADLLAIDECALIDDDIITAILPLREKKHGRLVVTSTPMWSEGSFWRWWTDPESGFEKIMGHYRDCGDPALVEGIEDERSAMSQSKFLREYELVFGAGGESLISHATIMRAMDKTENALCLN